MDAGRRDAQIRSIARGNVGKLLITHKGDTRGGLQLSMHVFHSRASKGEGYQWRCKKQAGKLSQDK